MNKPHEIMRECVELALLGKGKNRTNPIVGAVIVKDDKVIGRGFHTGFGNPHAEIEALRDASGPVEGADLYVTLEPCSHYGKTPPCVDAIIESGIKRVFIGVVDPNPEVAGKGINKLLNAGIEVYVGYNEYLCASIIEDFTKFVLKKKPYYSLKIAQSLDGKIATKTGDSKWITNESSRIYAHYLRSVSDAILIGVNTANVDNPMLDCRMIAPEVNPYKVVLDSMGRISLDLYLTNNYVDKLLLFTKVENATIRELEKRGAKIFIDESEDDKVDLGFVSEKLIELNLMNVLIEGGSSISGAFIDEKLVDKVYFFIAPKVIGGVEAFMSIGGKGVEKINDAFALKDIDVKQFESDVLISGKIFDYTEYVVRLTDRVRNRCSQGL